MHDMTPELRTRLEELGYEAARRYAATLNAVNAVEFAGESLALQLRKACIANNYHRELMQMQLRARISLLPLLEVPKSLRSAAVAACMSGVFRFSAPANV